MLGSTEDTGIPKIMDKFARAVSDRPFLFFIGGAWAMEVWPLERIIVGSRYRKDIGDLEELAASIIRIGLLQPIVVRGDGLLIAGLRRLEAVRLLGWDSVPVHVVNLEEAAQGERDENVVRKGFLPSEAVAIARALEPAEKEAARRRQATAGPEQGKGAKVSGGGKLPQPVRGKTRDRVARYCGMSGRTLDKAVAVVEAAEADPDRFGRLVDDMDRTGRVDGVFRRLKVMEQADRIAEEPALPAGPFRVIVADPPWTYHKRRDDPSRRGVVTYPDMATEEICALPVAPLAADDAVLWLWTTNAHMRDAYAVLDAWGFTEKTILTWVKDRPGMGDWLRGQTEHCILAVRGRPVVTLTNQSTVLYAAAREHSRKPEEFYRLVEALCPGSKLELFARERRPGWEAWGNDTRHFQAVVG